MLESFDSGSPSTIVSSVAITGLASGEGVEAIAFSSTTGALYGLGSGSHLYTISLPSGDATEVSSTALSPNLIGTRFSINFNPTTALIRLVDDSAQNLRISPGTGAVVNADPALTYASGDPHAGVNPDVVAVAQTNKTGAGSSATSTTAYAIDASLGNLDLLGSVGGSPNLPDSGLLTTVGSLGLNISGAVGFDIIGSSNTAYAALTPAGSGAQVPALYTINLTTGAATKVATIGDGSVPIIGLAATTIAAPSTPTLAPASDSGVSDTDHITNVNTPVIQGVALPGAAVTILANGVEVGQGTADGSGNYSIQTSILADGTYTVEALQTDASGLSSGVSAPLSPPLQIITAFPAPPGVPTLFSQYDTGFSDTDNFTRDNVPAFFGTGVVGDTVNLFANGVFLASGSVQSIGDYAIQAPQLADGVYQITAQQVDLAGNVSLMSAATTPPLTIDTSTRPTPAGAFVNQLYEDLLGRPADQAGLAYFSGIATQVNGRPTVAAGLLDSQEYLNNVATSAYQTLLQRLPGASSLAAASGYLVNHTDEQLKALIAGSAEYDRLQGSTTDGFLQGLYTDFLGRTIDAGGLAHFSAILAAGGSRTSVAYAILTSTEGQGVEITGLYGNLLGRAPDAAALANAEALLSKGGTLEQLITIIASSDEYFDAARGSDVVVDQWVNQIYLDLYGVAATAADQASVIALLDGPNSTTQVVAQLEDTDQFRAVLVQDAYEIVLGRAADPTSLTSGMQFLANGGTVQGLESILYGSDEYFQTQGASSNTTFLEALYQGVVNRPIDSGALTNAQALLAGGTSRTQLAAELLTSTEGARAMIQGLYVHFLRRVPTFDEFTGLSALLPSGTITNQTIIANMLGSAEYFSKL